MDIIVFHDEITLRTLFHGLVHATQMAFLGLDRYTDFYVRGFVKSRSWIAIPLEAQAYQLDTRFAMSRSATFSVEDEVKTWAEQGRYEKILLFISLSSCTRTEEGPGCLWGGIRGPGGEEEARRTLWRAWRLLGRLCG